MLTYTMDLMILSLTSKKLIELYINEDNRAFLIFSLATAFLLLSITLFVSSIIIAEWSLTETLFKLAGSIGLFSNFLMYLFAKEINDPYRVNRLDFAIATLLGLDVILIIKSRSRIEFVEKFSIRTKPMEPHTAFLVVIYQVIVLFYIFYVFFKIYKVSIRSYKKTQVKKFIIALLIGFLGVSLVLFIFSIIELPIPMMRFPIWFGLIGVSYTIIYKTLDVDFGIYHILPHRVYGVVITNRVGEPFCSEFYLEGLKIDEYVVSGYAAVSSEILSKLENWGVRARKPITIIRDTTVLLYKTENVIGAIIVERKTKLLEMFLVKAVEEIEREFGEKIKRKIIDELEMEEICLITKEILEPVLP